MNALLELLSSLNYMSSGNALRARPSGVAKMDPSAVSLDSNTRAEKFVVPNLTINDILRVIP